jgi:hypothetical protein
MRRFIERILGQQSPRRGDGFVAGLLLKEGPECLAGAVSKSLPFYSEPLLERRIAHVQAIEQITPVEFGGCRKGPGRGFFDQTVEAHGVNLDGVRINANRITLGNQRRRIEIRQRLTELGECLSQAGARLWFPTVAPQQARQLLTRLRFPRRQGKKGQQGLGLPRADRDLPGLIVAGGEPAQQVKPESDPALP